MNVVLDYLMEDSRHKLLFCWVSHSKILYQFGFSSLIPYESSFNLYQTLCHVCGSVILKFLLNSLHKFVELFLLVVRSNDGVASVQYH